MRWAAPVPVVPAWRGAAAAAAALAFLAVGAAGVRSYALNYWDYRGFAPPRDPAYVRRTGTQVRLQLPSPALGGRTQPVYVYLPPGYASSPQRRYSVVYLLHGVPGRPLAFLETVRMGVVEDELVARGRAQPAILVMPFGSTGTFTDEEWSNGIGRDSGWASFVSHDLVRAIDARYRTIRSGAGRAIAGLSEGGFGAIDIALHHPREFRVVESWSGYERPDALRSIYGPRLQLLPANDPQTLLPSVAARLRRAHVYFWIYSGAGDRLAAQNRAFAAELARYRVPHRFSLLPGGHNWALWRQHAAPAYLAAAARLARG